jgi:acetyltransferase-like isoleucine patch superfamily enzyme
MPTLIKLEKYQDDKGNVIIFDKIIDANIKVTFTGSNNTLLVHNDAKVSNLTVMFDCDHGHCEIGKNSFKGTIRVGYYCKVKIGDAVNCTGGCYISAAEYATVEIGDDCMIASQNEIRADDGHPIFDVESGGRINIPKSIKIGNHVWLGARAVVLGGADIGEGSVIGFGSIVKGKIPNNCIAVGVPAKVVKKNIAWERPHLTLTKPYFKPDAGSIQKSSYWTNTAQHEPASNLVEKKSSWFNNFIDACCAKLLMLKRND